MIRRTRWAAISLGALFLGLWMTRLAAQEINLTELVDDLQRESPDADALTLVWWMPGEYWEVALATNAASSEPVLAEERLSGAWSYCPWHGAELVADSIDPY